MVVLLVVVLLVVVLLVVVLLVVVLLVVVLLVVALPSSSLELSSHFSTISLHLYAHLTTKEYKLCMYENMNSIRIFEEGRVKDRKNERLEWWRIGRMLDWKSV